MPDDKTYVVREINTQDPDGSLIINKLGSSEEYILVDDGAKTLKQKLEAIVAGDVDIAFGTSEGTAAEGNDPRITGAIKSVELGSEPGKLKMTSNSGGVSEITIPTDALPSIGSKNLVQSGGVAEAINSAISGVYKFKGSATIQTIHDLGNAQTKPQIGDVYNIIDSGEYPITVTYSVSDGTLGSVIISKDDGMGYIPEFLNHHGYDRDLESIIFESSDIRITTDEYEHLIFTNASTKDRIIFVHSDTGEQYWDLPEHMELSKITLYAVMIEVSAGDNLVWTGNRWDKLAGTCDLSNYQEKLDIVDVVEIGNQNPVQSNAVAEAINNKLTNVYKYKGTVHYYDSILNNPSALSVGDVYNMSESGSSSYTIFYNYEDIKDDIQISFNDGYVIVSWDTYDGRPSTSIGQDFYNFFRSTFYPFCISLGGTSVACFNNNEIAYSSTRLRAEDASSGMSSNNITKVYFAMANIQVSKGDNIVWTGHYWDLLSNTVDLTGYLTTNEADSKYLKATNLTKTISASSTDLQIPTAKSVNSAIKSSISNVYKYCGHICAEELFYLVDNDTPSGSIYNFVGSYDEPKQSYDPSYRRVYTPQLYDVWTCHKKDENNITFSSEVCKYLNVGDHVEIHLTTGQYIFSTVSNKVVSELTLSGDLSTISDVPIGDQLLYDMFVFDINMHLTVGDNLAVVNCGGISFFDKLAASISLDGYVTGDDLTSVLAGYQQSLTIDTVFNANSNNPATSKAIQSAINTTVDGKLTGVYKFKGTTTVESLCNSLSGNFKLGDVYNVYDSGTVRFDNITFDKNQFGTFGFDQFDAMQLTLSGNNVDFVLDMFNKYKASAGNIYSYWVTYAGSDIDWLNFEVLEVFGDNNYGSVKFNITSISTLSQGEIDPATITSGYLNENIRGIYFSPAEIIKVSAGDNIVWDGMTFDKLAGNVDLSSYLTIDDASVSYIPKLSIVSDIGVGNNTQQVVSPKGVKDAIDKKLTGVYKFKGNVSESGISSLISDHLSYGNILQVGDVYNVFDVFNGYILFDIEYTATDFNLGGILGNVLDKRYSDEIIIDAEPYSQVPLYDCVGAKTVHLLDGYRTKDVRVSLNEVTSHGGGFHYISNNQDVSWEDLDLTDIEYLFIEDARLQLSLGDNVVWDGKKFDKLAGTVTLDTSNFLLKSNVDTALSTTSTNPVQNKVITNAINTKLSSVYKFMGTLVPSGIPSYEGEDPSWLDSGYVYNYVGDYDYPGTHTFQYERVGLNWGNYYMRKESDTDLVITADIASYLKLGSSMLIYIPGFESPSNGIVGTVYKTEASNIYLQCSTQDLESFELYNSITSSGFRAIFEVTLTPGDNVAVVKENGVKLWDKLASTIDLTGYAEKSSIKSSIHNAKPDEIASTLAVRTAINDSLTNVYKLMGTVTAENAVNIIRDPSGGWTSNGCVWNIVGDLDTSYICSINFTTIPEAVSISDTQWVIPVSTKLTAVLESGMVGTCSGMRGVTCEISSIDFSMGLVYLDGNFAGVDFRDIWYMTVDIPIKFNNGDNVVAVDAGGTIIIDKLSSTIDLSGYVTKEAFENNMIFSDTRPVNLQVGQMWFKTETI